MNYINEINAFYEIFLTQNPIPANAQALWHRLMAYCSTFSWKENFTLANTKLIEEVGFHTSKESKNDEEDDEKKEEKEKNAKTRAFERARNTLIQKGLIKYKKGSGNQCGSYTMISIAPSKKESNFVAQPVVQSVAQSVAQPVVQSVVQKVDNVLPLDKLNYTKLNETNIENDTRARGDAHPPTETKEKPIKETRHKYGFYKNVLFTDEELEKLKTEFPNDWNERIERLSEYIASKGKQYNNHLATIRSWARNDKTTAPVVSKKTAEQPDFSDVSRYDNLTTDSMDFKREGK